MIVYRFEYEDGSGIYCRSDNKSFASVIDDGPSRHPPPSQDSLIVAKVGYSYDSYHFGFSSLEQLRFWFYYNGWLSAMHVKGVVIAEYECHAKDVVTGNSQTLFKRKRAISKKQYNILEYFNLEK